MVKRNNKNLGDLGESIARKYLEKKGYLILDTNYRALQTEIDIVAKDLDELVFIEVKTRSSHKFGEAYEAVDEFKMQNIIRTSMSYIQKKNYYDLMVRYDIIEVYINEKKINHIKAAFDLS